jgi:hypothetical protein
MWARGLGVVLGLWLMAAPELLGYRDPASTSDRLIGPLVAAFSIIALWEVTRGLRWLTLPLGAWLVVAPWILGYGPTATVNSSVVGLLLVALALLGGSGRDRYGGGWTGLLRK